MDDGHQWRPLGVEHGDTSCILLPSALKCNAHVNNQKQEDLKEIVWCKFPIADVLRKRGLKPETSAAGDDF